MKGRDYLVVGLGRFGVSLALKLQELGHSVVGADRDAEVVQEWSGVLPDCVCLDTTDEGALRELGVEAFATAVVAIGDDFESSVLTTSLLKDLGVKQVVCKALNARQKQILIKVGADAVVQPEVEAGQQLATQLASRGRVVERMELEPGLSVTELRCPERLIGQTLAQSDLRRQHGLTVVAIRGSRTKTLPGPDETLQPGDLLVVIGKDQDVAGLAN